jgi:uncharacterized protein
MFIDTSAIFSILSSRDQYHIIARQTWDSIISNDNSLYCNNYVLVESFALIQNRLGMRACQEFEDKITPLINVVWITDDQHTEMVKIFLLANRRNLSLVDCASFVTMRRLDITRVFSLDKHFLEQGFEVIPEIP